MEIIKMPIGEIKPYEKNARKNDEAVNAVIESIKQCEYVAPIVVDENNVILAGHTRLKALKKLGVKEVEVCVKTGLTDEQKRKYRLLDNKTNEIAEWDFEMLADELDGLDFGELELDWGVNDADGTFGVCDFENDEFADIEKMEKHYGVPYQGNKSRIADIIISVLPKGDRLVDLFGGGRSNNALRVTL